MSQLSVEAYTAGIVEGVLDALDVVSSFSRVHGANLMIACKGHGAYGRDRTVPPTDCYSDKARSEGHGPRGSAGKIAHIRLLHYNVDE